MSELPIGIFDSGVGGLTVWKAVRDLLPNENLIYLADQKNCPYGIKPESEIQQHTENAVKYLLEQSCKLIVIACNTATAVAIDYLRENYNTIFVGLEPAVKPAALSTKTGAIGVLATENTLKGNHYLRTVSQYGKNITVNAVAGNGLVELIESSQTDSTEMKELLVKYLNVIDYRNIDHIVLGCTHYPFIKNNIQELCGNHIEIIDSSNAVAKQCKNLLAQNGLLNTDSSNALNHFYSTAKIDKLREFIPKVTYIKETEIQQVTIK
ncbi:glutamate racemase [Chondrinema litorale]|uniref:glutamate racemase n=1 Tax=Chondrinema litorale TaxID=2994555 RepID=UPI00254439C4|nr:glutamate racemase [Chondrinema litorale]UZR93982.1 glutamate racemase [Chondrinema litorale]